MQLPVILMLCMVCAQGATVYYEFSAAWFVPAESPDGFVRRVLGFNGVSPGPTITANIGDTLVVNVTNNFDDESLTVHWHGLFQINSNEQDGAEGVTQCGILPGEGQVYRFQLTQFGTYWYHAHSVNQYDDGLRGPLIIHSKEEPYEYVSDQIVMVNDWYHQEADILFAFYDSPVSLGNEPVPDSVLINGVGQGYCGTSCRYSTWTVPNYGPTRFRIINASVFAVIIISIDSHSMFVIEADGLPVTTPGTTVEEINSGIVGSTVTEVRINVAQRYSVLVFPTNESDTGSYWLRATMDDSVFATPPPSNTSFGIVSYGKPSIPSTSPTAGNRVSSKPCPNCVDPNDLINVNVTVPPSPTREIVLSLNFFNDALGVNLAYFNNVTCILPFEIPYINEVRAGLQPTNSCLNYEIPYGEVVRVIINNYDTGEHPIHMHGYNFWVLEQAPTGSGVYNSSIGNLNLKNPIKRDTATVYAGSYLVIEYVANNAGEWLFHCHVNWHMMVGLGLVWSIAPEQTVARLGPLTLSQAICSTK